MDAVSTKVCDATSQGRCRLVQDSTEQEGEKRRLVQRSNMRKSNIRGNGQSAQSL
jgi:hypothetical protein